MNVNYNCKKQAFNDSYAPSKLKIKVRVRC